MQTLNVVKSGPELTIDPACFEENAPVELLDGTLVQVLEYLSEWPDTDINQAIEELGTNESAGNWAMCGSNTAVIESLAYISDYLEAARSTLRDAVADDDSPRACAGDIRLTLEDSTLSFVCY